MARSNGKRSARIIGKRRTGNGEKRRAGIVVFIAGLALAFGLTPAAALADAELQNTPRQHDPAIAAAMVGETANQGDSPEAAAVGNPEGSSDKEIAKQLVVVQNTSQTYTVNVNVNRSECGSVSGAGTYGSGEKATLKATPIYGCVFECWKENDQVLSHETNYEITVNNDRTITAVFSKVTIDAIPDQAYTGEQVKPKDIKVGLDNVDSQAPGENYQPTTNDYTLKFGENVNVGEATVYATFSGDFTGEAKQTFKIVPADISGATVKAANQIYDGTALKPTPTVTWNKKQIAADDYTASYSNNVLVGTATVAVTGKHNFTESSEASGTFEIMKRSVTITADSAQRAYDGTPLTADSFTSEGLAEGDRVASAKVVGSQTNVGSSANAVSGAKIVNARGEDVTNCYDITYKSGTLTVAPDYEAASGSGGTWAKGSADALTFTFKRSPADETALDHFTSVLVDGEFVPAKNRSGNANWRAKKGSLVLSLQPSFLKTLSAREHTVRALFDDGFAEATFKVVAAPAKKKDKTPVVKMTAKGKAGLVVSWKKVKGAAGYDVFFARCNHDGKEIAVKKAATVKAGRTLSWAKTGLKEKTAYKARVKAYVVKNGKRKYIGSSPLVHAYTSDGTATRTNAKSLNVNKTKVSLKKGKSFKVEATVNKVDGGKAIMPSTHVARVRYRSTDKKVATVTAKGKVKARGAGTCYVYAYAHNGVYKRVKVTVK